MAYGSDNTNTVSTDMAAPFATTRDELNPAERMPARKLPTNEERVAKILRRHKALKREKQPWLATYQICGEYIFLRRQDFTRILAPGQFLTGKIFDGTAPKVLHQMASALIGALWPGGEKTFHYRPPVCMPKADRESDQVVNYYRRATKVAQQAINNPRAGFSLRLEEYMNDQGAFGISGIGVFETDDPQMPIRFQSIDTKQLTIDEDANGFVDTVFMEKEMTCKQVCEEYGIENVSKFTRDQYYDGRVDQKVKVLHAVEPRMERSIWAFGNANMPVASIHIEIDRAHILKESGFNEMPIFVTRFYKAMSEKYGRSPGMEAIPDILELNAVREAWIIAVEKLLKPPLAVTQSGAAGGMTLNTSAGGVSVRTVNGRIGESAGKWIEPIHTIGDIKPVKERIGEIQETIGNVFFMDRLLDLNNETRMTLGEANIREKLRGQALGVVFSRQVAELFTPTIQRVFHILYWKGLLGVPGNSVAAYVAALRGEEPFIIPEPVLKLIAAHHNVYDIEYITPAARIMRSEELMGIQQTCAFLEQLSPTNPGIFDYIDDDTLVHNVVELTGAPVEVCRQTTEVKKLQAARQASQQQQVQVDQGHIQAQTARAAGQAAEAGAKAGIPPGAILGGLAQQAGGGQIGQQPGPGPQQGGMA